MKEVGPEKNIDLGDMKDRQPSEFATNMVFQQLKMAWS